MTKQLTLPTLFMTLRCTEFLWNQLITIIATLHDENLTLEVIDSMNFFMRGTYLNFNPVLSADF